MNLHETRAAAEVMMEWATTDSEVEYRTRCAGGEWRENTTPVWDWHSYEYRISRQPLKCWANFYPGHVHAYRSKDGAIECCDRETALRIAVPMQEVEP